MAMLFLVVIAGVVGGAMWLIVRNRMARGRIFRIMLAFFTLMQLPSLAMIFVPSIGQSIVSQNSGFLRYIFNFIVMIPAYSGFILGYPAILVGVTVQALAMAGIGFYIWSGIERHTKRTSV